MGILNEIGSYDYHCPYCDTDLKGENGIEFITKKENGVIKSIFLDPNLGKYNYTQDYSSYFAKGEKSEFSCPSCKTNLQSTKHSDYIEIIMKVSEEVKFEVLFSRIFGVKRTYIVMEDYIEKHGEDILDFDELYEI